MSSITLQAAWDVDLVSTHLQGGMCICGTTELIVILEDVCTGRPTGLVWCLIFTKGKGSYFKLWSSE